MTRTARILGTGWDFLRLVGRPENGLPADGRPVQPAEWGTVHDDESVRQSVWIILGTAPGERVMRPDFGCAIHDLVFSVSGATTAGRAVRAVREALVRWEPRLELRDVRAGADPATPGVLLVEIDYRVRTTNNQFNLVYPFYLESTP